VPPPNPRAGRYAKQARGYKAFGLARLPPDPPLAMDPTLLGANWPLTLGG
jgi:hypothetical protein